ncbi:MAG: hypothetical protein AAF747_00435 [Planctomycetota bacterium]
MTASQRLLIGSLAVIAVMGLFLVTQYAAKPRMVPLLPTGAGGSTQQTVTTLQAAGISATMSGDQVVVPPHMQTAAVSVLAENGQLPNDTTLLFQNLLDNQGMHLTRQQNDQLYTIALQNELSRVISRFAGVRSATVLLDVPERRGLGRAVPRATASATVFTSGGGPIDQGMVDAVAQLIAGARAGLTADAVRVIDGSTGRQRRPTDKDAQIPTTYMEHAARVEQAVRDKIEELLAHVPGATIAVTAQVDVTQVQSETNRHLPLEQGTLSLPLREQSTSQDQTTGSKAAAPGVQSNTQVRIAGGSEDIGTSFTQTDDQTEFESFVGSERQRVTDPRGMPTRLAASINVPRSYIVSLIATDAPADGADAPEPTQAQIDEAFAAEQGRIRDSVLPHVRAVTDAGAVEGDVVVSMIPVNVPMGPVGPSQAGLFGMLAGGSSGGTVLGMPMGEIVDTAILGILALVSVGMMLTMVRRVGKRAEMPTPEEVVGIPPQLQTPDDLVGEADEGDVAIDGIEVDDNEARSAKLLEQVQEMVSGEPEVAAKMLSRWVTSDEES